jgi:hypothetical protein
LWLRWLVLEERDRVFPRKAPTIPDVGRRSSKGEAELQRCLMPLEIPEIKGARIVSTRDLDIPGKQYPRALGQLGIYCWTNKKAMTREAVETQSVVAAKISSFGPNEKIGANLRHECGCSIPNKFEDHATMTNFLGSNPFAPRIDHLNSRIIAPLIPNTRVHHSFARNPT